MLLKWDILSSSQGKEQGWKPKDILPGMDLLSAANQVKFEKYWQMIEIKP